MVGPGQTGGKNGLRDGLMQYQYKEGKNQLKSQE
jgi:hypothetical protein